MKTHKNLNAHLQKRFILPLFLLLLVGTFIATWQTQQSQRLLTEAEIVNCAVSSQQMAISQPEQTLFEQINQFRQQNNVPPLQLSLSLKQSAAWLSKDNLTRNTLSHTDSLGRETALRLIDCGLTTPSIVGEIIDSGNTDVTSLLNAWKHSPSQSTQLLDPEFNQIGVSLAEGTISYWTVTLAGPDLTVTATPVPASITPTSVTPSGGPSPSVKPSPTITKKPSPSPTRAPTPRPTNTPIPIPTKVIRPTQPPTPTPWPTIDPKFKPNPDDTQLFISVKIPGVGKDGNRLPKHQSRRVTATIYDNKNKDVLTGYADLQYDGNLFRGNLHLGKLPNGIYYVKISGERLLSNVVEPQFQNLNNSRLNVLPDVILRQGDVDLDNSLTITDYSLALLCFQEKSCQGKHLIDFNDDGKADVVDYNILLRSYFQHVGD